MPLLWFVHIEFYRIFGSYLSNSSWRFSSEVAIRTMSSAYLKLPIFLSPILKPLLYFSKVSPWPPQSSAMLLNKYEDNTHPCRTPLWTLNTEKHFLQFLLELSVFLIIVLTVTLNGKDNPFLTWYYIISRVISC